MRQWSTGQPPPNENPLLGGVTNMTLAHPRARDVRLDGQYVTWEDADFTALSAPGSDGPLASFLEIKGPEDVRIFVVHRGPLRLYPLPVPGTPPRFKEPIDLYIGRARLLRAFLSIAAALRAGRCAAPVDIERIGVHRSGDPERADPSSDAMDLGLALTSLLSRAGVAPWILHDRAMHSLGYRGAFKLGIGPSLDMGALRAWDEAAAKGTLRKLVDVDWGAPDGGAIVRTAAPRPSVLWAHLVSCVAGSMVGARSPWYLCSDCNELHQRERAPRNGIGYCDACARRRRVKSVQACKERKRPHCAETPAA